MKMVTGWEMPLYAECLPEIDPFQTPQVFRRLTDTYQGQVDFWKRPSPEPQLPSSFWDALPAYFSSTDLHLAIQRLAGAVSRWESDPHKILWVAILRAGVPIADWLSRLVVGSHAVMLSLFVGLGIDRVALAQIQADYPDRRLVFVDGWTGKGGVANELRQLGMGPLAVLVDPWGQADFCGTQADLLSPSAVFTGVATLGFSRAFVQDPQQILKTYLYPQAYVRHDVISAWQAACPSGLLPPLESHLSFSAETPWRIHSNEVCRALINAQPQTLFFADDPIKVAEKYSLLVSLANLRNIPINYNQIALAKYRTGVACTLQQGG